MMKRQYEVLFAMLLVVPAFACCSPVGHEQQTEGQQAGDAVMPRSSEVEWNCVKDGISFGFQPKAVPWVVNRVQGDRLWFQDEGISGWVAAGDVVPFADAVEVYTLALREQPNDLWTIATRGTVLMLQERADEAIADFDKALAMEPTLIPAWNGRAISWADKRDWTRSIADFNASIKLDATDPRPFHNRAFAKAKLQRYGEAIQDYDEAIRLRPDYALAFGNRGIAHCALGDYAKGVEDFKVGSKIAPDNYHVLNFYAWFLATCPAATYRDGEQAVTMAEKSCELTAWEDANSIGTLAAAYAELGKFDEARRYLKTAMEIEPDNDTRKEMRAAFEADKPYRDLPAADHDKC